MVPLADLLEQTLELIGTNVNGNPYAREYKLFVCRFLMGIGSKKHPVQVAVAVGVNPPLLDYQQLCSWFQDRQEGRVEGIVWHCNDGTLVKMWHKAYGDTFLNAWPVVIHVDGTIREYKITRKDLFTCLSQLNRHRFSRLQDIQFDP
ncbi:unnamed protein product [Coregonus sp. 'balchen']|nr:unnamed protein product [Coregonus sp. 'balchen']